MKGRTPKPIGMKILEGRRVPKGTGELDLPRGVGLAPDHLDAAGKAEWGRMSVMLNDVGVLRQTDRAVLAAYCDAYSIWLTARDTLKRTGLTTTAGNGVEVEHPCVKIVAKYLGLMLKYLVELGLSPVSRARIVNANVKASNEAGVESIEEFCSLKIAG